MKKKWHGLGVRNIGIIAIFGVAVLLAATTGGSARSAEAVENAPLPVFVSIGPQAFFVDRIGGGRVEIDVLLPAGKSPATYTPTPGQMSRLVKARLFFIIGVPFENALIPKIKSTAKNLHIVDTRKGIRLRKMAVAHHHIEGKHKSEDLYTDRYRKDHEKNHHHESKGDDPHIWLSPLLVKRQAKTICQALMEFDPEGEKIYRANFESFSEDLDFLNDKIFQILAPVKGETVFVFHPSFGYFTDAYGLTQMAVQIEGKAPKGKDLSGFIKKAKKERVRVIFVQPQFDRNAAVKIAQAIDGAVIPLDPLARDYLKNLERMADEIAGALKD